MDRPLHIQNARVWWDGHRHEPPSSEARDLFTGDHILDAPARAALTVDLDGCTLFPGLINAHDHLELNHYPRSKFRVKYDNAHQWGEDMNARLNESPYKELRAHTLDDRLFIGGLKNLLSGATTVAHHNPPHKALFRRDFPVHVLKRYGWSHSLHFSTDEEIVASYRATPPDAPWFIHLAEGTDAIAAGEFARLKALGCVGKNTVMVHAVGLEPNDMANVHGDVYGISHESGGIRFVWCPSSNLFLFGQTVHRRLIYVHARTTLGSDSRLTGDGDLLDEMRLATTSVPFDVRERSVISWVTHNAAQVLCVEAVGRLAPGAHADFIAIRSTDDDGYALCHSRRADLALVVKDGVPRIGDPDVMAKFPHIETIPAVLDGKPKLIHIDLARRYVRCTLREPGLNIEGKGLRRAATLRQLLRRGTP